MKKILPTGTPVHLDDAKSNVESKFEPASLVRAVSFMPTSENVQSAELWLQQHLQTRLQGFAGRQGLRPFFQRAHPFLQQFMAEIVADAPGIIAEIEQLLGGVTPPAPVVPPVTPTNN